MGQTSRSERALAWRRRMGVRMYRSGTPVRVIVDKLRQSRSWVSKWITYRTQHPWTQFPSGSRAPHHHPNQMPPVVERRVLRLRQQLVRHTAPGLRFAGVGACTIHTSIANATGIHPV